MTTTMTSDWTEYEQNAVLKVLQKALDDNSIPPEQRAAVVRGKQRIEKLTIRRTSKRPKEVRYIRCE